MKLLSLVCFVVSLYASDTYDEAMHYLEGTKGATEETRDMPRCPYERCDGKTTYIHVKKDLKKGYELLKKAHSEGDTKASLKVLDILLKQIDYKSKNYDEYLVKKLEADYGLNIENYNNDVLSVLASLEKSDTKEFRCKGAFGLYEANTKGYFGVSESNRLNMAKISEEIVLSSCSDTSLEYFKIINKWRK
ncbi:MAG: hypothetical protein WC656_01700 [Sulfurimonas sp.]|jgi:hypothetical protein